GPLISVREILPVGKLEDVTRSRGPILRIDSNRNHHPIQKISGHRVRRPVHRERESGSAKGDEQDVNVCPRHYSVNLLLDDWFVSFVCNLQPDKRKLPRVGYSGNPAAYRFRHFRTPADSCTRKIRKGGLYP